MEHSDMAQAGEGEFVWKGGDRGLGSPYLGAEELPPYLRSLQKWRT